MKYKLVIFDLDGTTLNTLDDLAGSLNYALEQAAFPKRTLDEVRSFVGNGIQKLVERGVPAETSAETIQEVLSEFKIHYKVHCADQTKPYEGIEKLLQVMKEKGYLMATVSNKADFAVQDLCKEYFPNMFDTVVGEKAGVRRKPAPDTVNTVLKQLNIDCRDAVYVGDSEVDVETAKNAGMDCISVNWGFRTREELLQAGAITIVSHPDEILNEI
ncbi:MAG: HAD family hydrolase [Lachnospira sp.]|nr:HAD family hydrolase [Lachnospira sp.]